MKKFIWGISIFWYGELGALITYIYTLLHQTVADGKEGWIVNFVANDTLAPLIVFIILMIMGSVICVKDTAKHDGRMDKSEDVIENS